MAQAVYIGNSSGAKPSHDTYVTPLNQASATLNLDIATLLAEQLPFRQLHEQLTAFASGKGFEEGLLSAMALMAERGSVKELGSCSAQTISKALALDSAT